MERHINDKIAGADIPGGIRTLRDNRNRWLNELDVRLKNERLFELEMYLKSLDRFCNVRNHPISDIENIFERDFKIETQILRETISRVISLVRKLLPQDKTSAFHFKQYVERRLMSDRARMEMMELSLRQNSPEESLYVLESGMTSLREMVSAVLSLKKVSYLRFYHLGQFVSREIAWNTFFNPFQIGEFSPNHDRIRNAAILKVVRNQIPDALRKEISIIFLIAFRLLHYLQYVKEEDADRLTLLKNLPLFVLVKSEIGALIDYLESDLPRVVREKLPGQEGDELAAALDSLAFQLGMEGKKVYDLEIKDAATQTDINMLITGMARAKGVLVEILRQVVVQLARTLDISLEGRHIFRDFISRTELSLKLRKDIWIFHKVIENFDRTISDNLPKKDFKPILEAFKSLRNYIFYFQNVSFQMVRFTDREAFEDFFGAVDGFNGDSIYDKEQLEDLLKKVHSFFIFLETTLGNVSQRSELKEKPFGKREGEYILEQFLK